MNKIENIEKDFMKKNVPSFNVGDMLKVSIKIKEGDKTRLQAYEGTCIAKKGSGVRQTFTVRRISYGEGVERIFQLHSPLIDSVKVVKKGKVRRAKLYYLRKKVGKHTKIEEDREFKQKEDAPLGEKGLS
ncbi:MAG: 50S ribosomal protein L19 [Candidatus Omnitrophica bacterium]|nr:50S ribosomal protein L19 [Candidatus Omnitrophota bacterium]